ncbi:hypothetical protein ACFFX0_26850 [Citricoccus parietis]|uniref:Secreted protein n=1 Tax=Citricoccus parietis TaxID=592307 RepID=A0ABV5G6N9_9MICC
MAWASACMSSMMARVKSVVCGSSTRSWACSSSSGRCRWTASWTSMSTSVARDGGVTVCCGNRSRSSAIKAGRAAQGLAASPVRTRFRAIRLRASNLRFRSVVRTVSSSSSVLAAQVRPPTSMSSDTSRAARGSCDSDRRGAMARAVGQSLAIRAR